MKVTYSLSAFFAFFISMLAGDAKLPNVVFILSDDHTYRDIGAYGNTDVHTPNLDLLASQGMRFDRAYAAAALCTPTRLAIASGQWPHGKLPNAKDHKDHLIDRYNSMGYYTVSVAKTIPGQFDKKIKCGKTSALPAVNFLRSYEGNEPLFMVFGAEGTHLDWPQDEADRYDSKVFKIAPNLLDTQETRKRLKAYYSSVTCVDNQVGQLMEAIERKGWVENTIVIYTSDQGASFPFAKWCLYEDGIRVPLIFRFPGIVKAGSHTSALVSQVDFAATFLELSGMNCMEAEKNSIGRSFVSVLKEQKNVHREIVFASHRGDHGRGEDPLKDAMPKRHHNRNPALAAVNSKYKMILNLRPEVPFGIRLNGYCNSNPRLWPQRPVTEFWREWESLERSGGGAAKVVKGFLFRDEQEFYDLEASPWEQGNQWDGGTPEALRLMKELKTWQMSTQSILPDYGKQTQFEKRR